MKIIAQSFTCCIRLLILTILFGGLTLHLQAQYQDFQGYDVNRLNQGSDFLKTVYSLSSDRMSAAPEGVKLGLDATEGPFDYTFRAEVREKNINTYPQPRTSQTYRIRFQIDELPDLYGPLIIFQRFNRDLDAPDLAIELTGANQFRDAVPNDIQVVAFGERLRMGKFLKNKNDLLIVIYNDDYGKGKYKVSLNGETLKEKTGIRTLASTQGSWSQFGIYGHGLKDSGNRNDQVASGNTRISFIYNSFEKQSYSGEVDLNSFNTADYNQAVPSNCGVLPEDWSNTDVGQVQIDGYTCYDNSRQSYQLGASGADIWGSQDQFHFLYQPMDGDGEIVARLVDLGNTNEYAKAGLMMRENLNTNSRYVSVLLNQNKRAFQYRSQSGSSTQIYPGWEDIGTSHGAYVRLVRINDVFAGFTSTDGQFWNFVHAYELSNNPTVLGGLALTSHNNSTLNTAVFDNIAVEKRTLESTPTALPPVEFTAVEKEKGLRLTWNSEVSSNQGFFEVERSLDGLIYERIGRVFHGGYLGNPNEYYLKDQEPIGGNIHYRLKLQNYDGSFGYVGHLVVARSGLENRYINVYPNPVNSNQQFTIEVRGTSEEEIRRVSLVDLAGRTVVELTPNQLLQEVAIPANVLPGLYLLQVDTNEGPLSERLLLK